MNFLDSWRISVKPGNEKNAGKHSIFRYMDEEYINRFFETGELKLSTYFGNRDIKDSTRKDTEEGKLYTRLYNKSRSFHIDMANEPYKGWFTFCTSLEYNPKKFYEKFQTNGVFEITNTTAFGYEIAKVLPKYMNGFEGLIEYTNNRSSVYFLENYPEFQDFDKNTDSIHVISTITEIIKDPYALLFQKRTSFKSELEYRHVWRVFNHNESEFIKCPGALKYCRRIS